MSRTTDKNYDHLFQVLLCGDSSVGKTCLISRFADNEFRQTHINTIGQFVFLAGEVVYALTCGRVTVVRIIVVILYY